MKHAGKFLTLFAAGAVLASCGGGDDAPAGRGVSYTGSTAALVISPTNVATIAALAETSAFGSVAPVPGGPSYFGAASIDRRIGWETALATLQRARRDTAVALTGAYGSATESCPGGGTLTLTASTASDVVTTTGDYFELGANVCNDGAGTIVNGRLRVQITGTDGADPTLGPPSMTSGVTYGMRLVVTDFSIEDPTGWAGMEGDMELSQVWSSITFRLESSIQGGSFVSAAGVGSTVAVSTFVGPLSPGGKFSMTAAEEYTDAYATTLYASESGINARVCSLELAGCIRIETAQPFRQLAAQLYPASGSFRVSDELGHYIELVPTDGATGAVTVSWDVVADATTPDGTCNTTWPEMATCFP